VATPQCQKTPNIEHETSNIEVLRLVGLARPMESLVTDHLSEF
jgi:hypothetical protein